MKKCGPSGRVIGKALRAPMFPQQILNYFSNLTSGAMII